MNYIVYTVVSVAVLFVLLRLARVDVTVGGGVAFLQIAAQYLVVDFDIGPVSLRVYNALLMGGLAVLALMNSPVPYRTRRWFERILSFQLLWLAWVLVSSMGNGSLAAPESFAYDFASKFLVPILVLVGCVGLVRTQADVLLCLCGVVGLAFANVILIVLQSRGVEWAWSINDAIHPIDYLRRTQQEGSEWLAQYPPGLSGYSVPAGYVLLCYGGLLICFSSAALASKRFLIGVVLFGGWAGVLLGCALAMSRSSLYLGGLLTLAAFVLVRKRSGVSFRGPVIGLLLSSSLLLGFFGLRGKEVGASNSRLLEIDRIFSVGDDDRLAILSSSFERATMSPIFGISRDLAGDSRIAPHNSVVAAALYYGLFGAVLSIGFVILVVAALRSEWVYGDLRMQAVCSKALTFAILMYIAKGLVHNDSFTTGGGMGFFLLGLWLANLKLSDRTRVSKPKRIFGGNIV